MVRKGSTVRVRQRALAERLGGGGFGVRTGSASVVRWPVWKLFGNRAVLVVVGGLLVEGWQYPRPAGCRSPGVLNVRATPLNRECIHSPAGDEPGRAVFRRGVTPREGTFESLVRLANRRGRQPGRPAGRGPQRGSRTEPSDDHDRLQHRALVRPVRRPALLRRRSDSPARVVLIDECDRPADGDDARTARRIAQGALARCR